MLCLPPTNNPTTEYTPPRTATERVLAGLWAETFGLERVGIHDNFFDLGGHSLLVTHLISKIRAAFDVELPLGTLFEVSTIAGLAERLDQAQAAARPALRPGPASGGDPALLRATSAMVPQPSRRTKPAL